MVLQTPKKIQKKHITKQIISLNSFKVSKNKETHLMLGSLKYNNNSCRGYYYIIHCIYKKLSTVKHFDRRQFAVLLFMVVLTLLRRGKNISTIPTITCIFSLQLGHIFTGNPKEPLVLIVHAICTCTIVRFPFAWVS